MALSLQEQLLKAGLADKAKAKKARQEKHKKAKANKGKKAPELDEAKRAALEAAQAKKQKDLALAEAQKQSRLEKEIKAQAIDLVKSNIQPRGNGDIVLNFTDDNKVKRMYVNAETHKQVTQGRLVVVSIVTDEYELVPAPVAEKIAQRLPDIIIYQAAEDKQEKAASEEDDWYADYEIPDDLVW
jgi:uncharacterized protein YaiL (DUF2058 family)